MSHSRERKIRAIIKSCLPDTLEFLKLYNGTEIGLEDEIYQRTGIKLEDVTKVEWFYSLFDVIEDYIDKPFLTKEDKEIINSIFPTISTIYSYCEYEPIDVSIELLKLTHAINKKLDNLTDDNYKDYKELQNRLVELAIANNNELMDIYDGYDFNLILYILFEKKDYEFSSTILEEYPSLIYLKFNGEYLFNIIVDKYLKALKNAVRDSFKDTTTYEYYSNLINIFLNNQELHISSKSKKNLLEKINNYKVLFESSSSEKKIRIFEHEVDELIERIELISDIDINNLMKKFDIDMDFDPVINQEYYSLRRPEDQIDNFEHEVLSNTCVISIDTDNSGIYDDALSIEEDKCGNYLLSVHIADPTNYVLPGGLIDQKARERAFSFLFGKSMFPKGLLNDYLSLKEGVPRYANTFVYTIDKKGRIINEEYKKTLLMVNKNLTVNEANNIIENGAKNEYLDLTLKNLNKCKDRLDHYFNFDPEYEEEKGSSIDIANARIEGKDNASTIVRYAMALVNNRVAKMAHEKRMPFIYRNFKMNGDGIGEYSTRSRGHDGLNLDDYGHVTCPLRRYIDFANALALNIWLFNEPNKDELHDLDMDLKYIAYSVNSKQQRFKNLTKTYKKSRG